MNHEELFVGAVAIVLGVAGLIAAVANRDSYYRLDKVRWFETVWGRRGARLMYGVIGALLIALGITIAFGFGPNKTGTYGVMLNSNGR